MPRYTIVFEDNFSKLFYKVIANSPTEAIEEAVLDAETGLTYNENEINLIIKESTQEDD